MQIHKGEERIKKMFYELGNQSPGLFSFEECYRQIYNLVAWGEAKKGYVTLHTILETSKINDINHLKIIQHICLYPFRKDEKIRIFFEKKKKELYFDTLIELFCFLPVEMIDSIVKWL